MLKGLLLFFFACGVGVALWWQHQQQQEEGAPRVLRGFASEFPAASLWPEAAFWSSCVSYFPQVGVNSSLYLYPDSSRPLKVPGQPAPALRANLSVGAFFDECSGCYLKQVRFISKTFCLRFPPGIL